MLIAVAGALAGCGGSPSPGTEASPATLVPGSAALYLSAAVNPPEGLRRRALSDARRLSGEQSPFKTLLGLLRAPGGRELSYGRNLEPWIGRSAGLYIQSSGGSASLSALVGSLASSSTGSLASQLLGSLAGSGMSSKLAAGLSSKSLFADGSDGPQGAIVLDTSDLAKARSFLQEWAREAHTHKAGYRGVSFQVAGDGLAAGIVDRFAVIGSRKGLQSVIETAHGGVSLAHDGGYSKLTAAAPSGSLAHLYVSPSALAGSLGESAGVLEQLLGEGGQIDLSLVPAGNSIALDVDSLGGKSEALEQVLGPAGAKALGELPAGSWLAVGLGDLGGLLRAGPQQAQALLSLAGTTLAHASAGPGDSLLDGATVKGMLEGVLTPLRSLSTAELHRDLLGWMTSAGIFASGSGLLDLKAGLVVQSSDATGPREALTAFAKLARAHGGTTETLDLGGTEASLAIKLPSLPIMLYLAAARSAGGAPELAVGGTSELVVGLSEASIAEDLRPAHTLAGSSAQSAAGATLGKGIEPSMSIDFGPLQSMFETLGLNEDPTASSLLSSLRPLTTLTAGTSQLGSIRRLRIVLGLQRTA